MLISPDIRQILGGFASPAHRVRVSHGPKIGRVPISGGHRVRGHVTPRVKPAG